jgi:hypothetical protein
MTKLKDHYRLTVRDHKTWEQRYATIGSRDHCEESLAEWIDEDSPNKPGDLKPGLEHKIEVLCNGATCSAQLSWPASF